MATNEQFRMKVKNNLNGYTELSPKTVQSQVLDWGIGETYGPYTITLQPGNWQNNEQIIKFNGVISSDIIACIKVLSGTKEEMIEQDRAYSLIKHNGGVLSDNDEIKFVCTEPPDIAIQVQVWWTR